MRILFAIISTIINAILIISYKKSKDYDYIVENLEDYPLSEIYSIGFAMMDLKIFSFKDDIINKLMKNASVLYGSRYAEYYSNVAFAQATTFIACILSAGFSFAAIVGGKAALFVILLAVVLCVVVWNFSVMVIGDSVKERRENCYHDFPDMVTKFALLINAGMVLRDAWFLVAQNGDSDLYKLMRESCDLMRNGSSDFEAIVDFGIRTDSPEIKKFTSSMVQGIEKGNSELADFLLEQSNEMVSRKRQQLLQEGEKAAGKLIIPIAITFIGVIVIIAFSAMQSMSF